MDYARAVSLKMSTSKRTPNTAQNSCKLIDLEMRIELINRDQFNATILKFFEKFYHQFLHVYIFGNMFPESHGFIAVPVTRSNHFVSVHQLDTVYG